MNSLYSAAACRTIRLCAWLLVLAAAALGVGKAQCQFYSTLYSFGGDGDGGMPQAGLAQGSDGNLYGTTTNGGGSNDGGTVFKITTSGSLTTLYTFTGGNDGNSPYGGLIQGGDGNFYGTTETGGSNGEGTVFEITASGSLTTLYSFGGDNDGANPYAGLVQGSDGNLYGTTYGGGTNMDGTVFQITTSGSLATLYSFTGENDGGAPEAGLVQGSDGNFYGTAYGTGTNAGAVFKITASGSLTTLYTFTGGNDGNSPCGGLIQGSDGNFYGTTYWGGSTGNGAVFQITTSGSLKTLYSFTDGDDGENPQAGLVQGSDGNFYGTTNWGGINGAGTAFQITTSGSLATLYSFSGDDDGGAPEAGLVQGSDGNFYGTTNGGGGNSAGTVFQLDLGFASAAPVITGALSATGTVGSPFIYQITAADGPSSYDASNLPQGLSVDTTTGLVSGTPTQTGTFDSTISATDAGGTGSATLVLTVLEAPTVSTEAVAAITSTSATLSGAASPNGSDTQVYFESGTDTTYGNATAPQDMGSGTTAVLVSGTLSGLSPDTTYHFRLDATNSAGVSLGGDVTFTTLADPVIGGNATASITGGVETLSGSVNPEGVDTTVYYQYGTTTGYGSATTAVDIGSGTGTVVVSGTPSGLQVFTAYHYRIVTTSAAGTFYGPDQTFTAGMNFSTLYSFSEGNDGAAPQAGLIQGSDGNYYGTTNGGGSSGNGAVFEITASGSLTTLYSFTGGNDGANPYGGLVQGGKGNFYGTTETSGSNGAGTVFELTASGSLTTLYSFSGGNDGGNPYAGLVQGSDGNLYGTTNGGGSSGAGTVFKITASGSFATLYSFTGGDDGGAPQAGLVQASDGNLYGTTDGGGSYGDGTVFEITTGGMLTTLYSFTGGDDGGNPQAGLVQGSDGNFYGTTNGGGINGAGTAFQITASGSLATLYSFSGDDDGGTPEAGLVQGSDGALYGTTNGGGGNNAGTVFQIDLGFASVAPVITGALNAAGTVGSPFIYQITAADGPSSYDATNLPQGLSVDTTTGLVSGTPTQTGTFNSTISANNAGGRGSATLVLTVLEAPTVATEAVAAITSTSATLSGAANPNGSETQVYFESGTDTTYGNATAPQDIGSGTTAVLVSGTLSGLSPDTTYHFRLDATNSAGVSLGGDVTFTTLADPVIGGSATAIITGGVETLSGSVNPEGVDTAVYYQYGTTTGYGSATTAVDVGNGMGAVVVSGSPSGLQAFTTYHYRIVTTSEAGTFYGPDQTFTAGMNFSTLYSFSGGNDGASPQAGLIQGSDGNYYGTTNGGGSSGNGSVFEITASGSLTTLYSFTGGNDGANPCGSLVQSGGGNFYGTTETNGSNGAGTVFEITASGSLTTLYSFSGSNDGGNPYAGLVQGNDGNFYGTTNGGGSSGAGTVFEITASGSLTTLYSFTGGNDGANPYAGLIEGSDGNLYGTTNWGGNSGDGTVFEITASGTLTTLHSFTGANDGENPYAGLVQGRDGNFYGTTQTSGSNGAGTVFKISTSGSLATLYFFSAGNHGGNPYAGLIQGSDGNFYGTTNGGGINGAGTAFQITASGSLTTLYSFTGGDDGGAPEAGVVQGSDGNFYGTVNGGGGNSAGAVFQINMGFASVAPVITGALNAVGTVGSPFIYQITAIDGPSGYGASNLPHGLGLQSSGLISGTPTQTGTFNSTISATNAAGAVSAILVLTVTLPDPVISGSATTNITVRGDTVSESVNPEGVDTTVHFQYGTTTGYGSATAAVDIGSGTDAVLVTGTLSGVAPFTTYHYQIVTTSAAGTFYGPDETLAPDINFTSLHSFTNGNDGGNPYGGLVQAGDGNFYGMTYGGGVDGEGVVFKMATSGSLTTLHSFTGGNDGAIPVAGLVQGGDGNFYGTAETGGSNGSGVVFQVTASGSLTALYSFTGGDDGANPEAGLVQGSEGNFYGTTNWGGVDGAGVVYQITASGSLTTLYSFTGGNDGGNPYAGLVQGTDGNFYGTTETDGSNGAGTVFKITASGSLTTLYSFTGGNDGGDPYAGLVQGTDGNFYGTTETGGSNSAGTVFKITAGGSFTTLYSFTGGNDGGNPYAGLAQGTDGNFYGTTETDGGNGAGTVFEITASGSLTTLYSFTGGNDGANPQAGLVQGSDGSFYGTTYGGGVDGDGALFKLDLGFSLLAPTFAVNAAAVTGTAVTLSANVDPNGFAGPANDPTNIYVSWQYGVAPGVYASGTTPSQPIGTGTSAVPVSFTISGSGQPPSVYYYQLIVSSAAGNTYGPAQMVLTMELPAATTGTASAISSASATIAGTANPNGEDTRVCFEYGLDTTYGTTTAAQDIGGSMKSVAASSTLTGLVPSTTYHFRLDATSIAGTTLGNDAIFTTLAVPVISGSAAATVTAGGQSLSEIVNPEGVNTTVHYQYGTTTGYGSITESKAIGSGTSPVLVTISASGLTPFATYHYQVVTTSAAGTFYGPDQTFTAGPTFMTLHAFSDGNDGGNPRAGLAAGIDGNFYGTTSGGGSNGDGTIFQITASGSLTILYSFTGGGDGSSPQAGLVQGADGYFYGTAELGGTNGAGTVFKITASGSLSMLYTFTGGDDGADPKGQLIQGDDGNFYGTTSGGGVNGVGTAFQITASGSLTTLHSFTGGSDGGNPCAGLVQGSDGSLYGTTGTDGNGNAGTVFKITANGSLATLYSFSGGTDGGWPETALIQGSDGNFYGTTSGGGVKGAGTVFKVTTSGSLTMLHGFTGGSDGGSPQAGLIQGIDGNLYGSTSAGGISGAGTMFEITASGSLTTVYSFLGGSDEGMPEAALVQQSDGSFYGTTFGNSNGTYGTVFKLIVAPTYTVNAVAVSGGWVKLSGTVNPNGFTGPAANTKNVLVTWQYGLAAGSYTKSTGAVSIGSGTTAVPVISSLSVRSLSQAIYHYQIVISSTLGIIYGPDQTFSVDPPKVVYPAPVVTSTSAVLSPTVNPNGLSTMVYIEYGLTAAYTGTASEVLSSGTTPVAGYVDLTGLAPDTAYHYRVVTINALGTVYGPDQAFTTQALFSTAAIVSKSNPAPGIAGAVFSTLGNPAINDSDHTAFQATVTGSSGSGVTTANNSGIWAGIGTNGLTLIARTGTSAPGYTSGAAVGTFATLSDPVYSNSDAVAFIGTLSGSGAANVGVTKSNNTGIWATTSGPLLLVARAGDPAPDENGATSPGGPVFASFPQFVLPDQGGVIILANLVVGKPGLGGVVASTSQGIWAVDTDGTLKQIIRTGSALTANGSAKVISGLAIFNAPAASTGQTRHFNHPGDLIYKVTFTDHSTGFVESVFP